jgi:EAL domain-containing protein (putative c-di-GMP-specific phosphodiesterase class I)
MSILPCTAKQHGRNTYRFFIEEMNQQTLRRLRLENELRSETGCAPGWMGLEITEQMLMKETKKTIKILTLLHDRGIELSIDDFGKGYSSLSYLSQLPISSLKIDRSFVGKMAENIHGQAIASALIHWVRNWDSRSRPKA